MGKGGRKWFLASVFYTRVNRPYAEHHVTKPENGSLHFRILEKVVAAVGLN